jgi:Cu2+-exporting ATPase
MARDFRDRLVVSAAFTVPVLALSPMIQGWAGVSVQIPGGKYVLFALSAFVYGYGGYPFTTGLLREVRSRAPGMMTLVGLAITVSFLYSSAVVFGLEGSLFFWELVTLIDLMLLGHWIEMRSVTGASGALEALARLLPAMAHRVDADELAEDVPVTSLRKGDLVLVRPGESVPADGTVHHGSSSV